MAPPDALEPGEHRSAFPSTAAAPGRKKLAIVVSHPIQHFVPFYRALARREELDLHVIFGTRVGLKPYFDSEMNTMVSWNMDLLSGYSHSFLPKADKLEEPSFFSLNDPAVGGELARFGPDVVLIHGYASITHLRALRWCRSRRVPAMLIGDSELKQERPAGRERIRRIVLPQLLKRFSAFLTVGDENERYYDYYGVPRSKMFRSPFTIDEESFRSAIANRDALRSELRREHGIPGDAFVALFVGKLSDRKRPEDLLLAAEKLAGGGRVHALFAGNGPLMDRVRGRGRAVSNATFLGFVNVDRLPAVYLSADVLVHTSAADPHPLVCSEAAICGLPMILSDRVGAAGVSDVARPNENALIYPCGDVAKLTAAVDRLAGDNELYGDMAEASARIFAEVDLRASIDGILRAIAACTAQDAKRVGRT